jgi:hypothetical protein
MRVYELAKLEQQQQQNGRERIPMSLSQLSRRSLRAALRGHSLRSLFIVFKTNEVIISLLILGRLFFSNTFAPNQKRKDEVPSVAGRSFGFTLVLSRFFLNLLRDLRVLPSGPGLIQFPASVLTLKENTKKTIV